MDTKTLLEAVEIIRNVKSLFAEQDPYLPVYAALGGALLGAVASIIPTTFTNWQNTRKERRSTASQLYAEIKSYLEVMKLRKYIEQLESVVDGLATNKFSSYSYQVQVNDERFIVFKNSIGQLGLLDIDIQVKIVEFYQLLEAIIQDVKPGGLLNVRPAGLEAFKEALYIAGRIKAVGEEVTSLIEKNYKVK